ncbi:uncharacterized protein LOC126980953 isoform X2 [Eriocheir sinensis]|uniref:uncharacterized protein LOC126980953 isoform X2 n=1 Tax=Eriocheir sinensis TaxID=95602 RepID=UPI0021C60342|nr:uncharacterized protein LOC126980953 isoform X2 [Eriocheir sinensis]
MVISRSPDASRAVSGQLRLGGKSLPLQDHIKVLGVTVDQSLRFDLHIRAVARQASLRVSALRRVAGSLDPRGILTLFKAQIRPYLEYGALCWMASAATHMLRLDAVQRRALRLVEASEHLEEESATVPSLEHRRDVSALVVCHKAQVQGVPHLSRLRLPPRAAQRFTRTTLSGFFCGGKRHPRSRCLARASVCRKCGKTGHYASVCRSGDPGRSRRPYTAAAATMEPPGSTSPVPPCGHCALPPTTAATPVLASVTTPRSSTIPII